MARFVLWGTYCEDALEKRTPFREEHLSRLTQLKESGRLITLGPTEGSTHVFGIFEAESREEVQSLLHDDIFACRKCGYVFQQRIGDGPQMVGITHIYTSRCQPHCVLFVKDKLS